MALTNVLNQHSPHSIGDLRAVVDAVVLDSSYPTGGYPVTPATFGLTFLAIVVCENVGATATYVEYDSVNAKLKAFVRTTGVEVANAVDLSAVKLNVLAIGK